MNTFDEISVSELGNFKFWTAQAKFSLACLREAKCKNEAQQVTMYRNGFKKNMQNRRIKYYLNEELRTPLPFIEY